MRGVSKWGQSDSDSLELALHVLHAVFDGLNEVGMTGNVGPDKKRRRDCAFFFFLLREFLRDDGEAMPVIATENTEHGIRLMSNIRRELQTENLALFLQEKSHHNLLQSSTVRGPPPASFSELYSPCPELL